MDASTWERFRRDSAACREYQRTGVRTKCRAALVQIVKTASGDGWMLRAAVWDVAGQPAGVEFFRSPEEVGAFLDKMVHEDGGLL